MILPVIGYGNSILKRKSKEITDSYPGLKELIKNMYDTMYNASGVGLAAPQIGKSIKIFIIDTSPFLDMDDNKMKDYEVSSVKQTFINPTISWNLYIFSKNHEGKKEVYLDDYLTRFMKQNFDINKFLNEIS